MWCLDDHCLQLVQSGFAVTLLALLDRNPVDIGSSVTHHAVLSALRNLAIPGLFSTPCRFLTASLCSMKTSCLFIKYSLLAAV